VEGGKERLHSESCHHDDVRFFSQFGTRLLLFRGNALCRKSIALLQCLATPLLSPGRTGGDTVRPHAPARADFPSRSNAAPAMQESIFHKNAQAQGEFSLTISTTLWYWLTIRREGVNPYEA